MPAPAEDQARFAAALLDPAAPPPKGLVARAGWRLERRFQVYRNNVLSSLAAALALRFPVVARLVGSDFFQAMARRFVLAAPPRSPLLLAWGEAFPTFIEGFAPAAELPYLADVARLENAWWGAYHAAEAEPLPAAVFATTDPAVLLAARLDLHPATRLATSPHPIVAIWAVNTQESEVRPIAGWRGEDALVTRPAATVEIRRLPAGGHTFIAALAAGASLNAAAEAALAAAPAFDLARNLAGLVEAGAISGLRQDPEAAP
jgi:hypothetical protein